MRINMKKWFLFLSTILFSLMLLACKGFTISGSYNERDGLKVRGSGKFTDNSSFKIGEDENNEVHKTTEKKPNRVNVKYDDEKNFGILLIDYDNSAKIIQYLGNNRQVNVPALVQRTPVTIIGEKAFFGKRLLSVTIPIIVRSIENEAFASNPISDITIGANVELGKRAFDRNFCNFYILNGSQSGRYIYRDNNWELR